MSTTVTYKGSTLTTVNNATKTLKTSGKYMEDDVTITDVTQSGGVVVTEEVDAGGGIIKHITAVEISGTKQITENGTYDVTEFAQANVNVSGGGGGSYQTKTVSPSTSQQIVTPDTGYDALSQVTVEAMPVGSLTVNNLNQTANPSISINNETGVITSSVNVSGAYSVGVRAGYISSGKSANYDFSGSSTESLTTKSAATYTPTTSSQTIASGVFLIGDQTIAGDANLIPGNIKSGTSIFGVEGTYAGSTINNQNKTITPTTSQQTVTADSGYSGLGTVTVNAMPTMTLPTAASSTSSGTSKATIGRSTSAQYINIPTGYNSSAAYYTVSATPNGSATGPSSLSGSSATVTTGTNTITLTKTGVSTTPTVSAGYVASATASTATVALTASVTTKAAATITPGTTNQTIASGTYLTGTQTIAGDSNLVGSNILSGKSIFGVAGTVAFQTYYTGSSAPSSSTGVNGDIYLQT